MEPKPDLANAQEKTKKSSRPRSKLRLWLKLHLWQGLLSVEFAIERAAKEIEDKLRSR